MIEAGTKETKSKKDDDVYEVLDSKENFEGDLQMLQEKMRLMIHDSGMIHLNDKAQIIQMMHDTKMRMFMTEILSEITAPKRIENIDCLRLIADILRFVLTLFVHEEGCDYRLLSVILDVSQYLYFVSNRRKQYLSYYLVDHGIWSDSGSWRECIEVHLKFKMHESVLRMKRRASRASSQAAAQAKEAKEKKK